MPLATIETEIKKRVPMAPSRISDMFIEVCNMKCMISYISIFHC